MAYQHDEIVSPIGDGFSIAWDSTYVDKDLEDGPPGGVGDTSGALGLRWEDTGEFG
jgi:hypothetical protein